ncbi:hypothetical protein Hanom_Chr10g00927371 [Helianthus anomalus]
MLNVLYDTVKPRIAAERFNNTNNTSATLLIPGSGEFDGASVPKRRVRWSNEKECFVDPQGNGTVDPEKVDFKALVAAIPTVSVWCKDLEEIPRYREKVEEGIRKVIYASLKKNKKTVKEIVDESEKLVKEVKKEDEKSDEVVAEKQRVIEEVQNQQAKEATLPNTEVTIQTDSFVQSIDNKAEYQCKKCMETCSA